MKIRTDFVTNSSSSCFCAITITLKEQTKLHWEDACFQDHLVFDLWGFHPQELENLQTVAELLLFLKKYTRFEEEWNEVYDKLARGITGAESIDSLYMSCNQYLSDQGLSPENGAEGWQLTCHFSTGECALLREPDPEFIADMNRMFCWD